MNTTANIIQEDKQALVVECGTKRLYVQHAGKGDIRLAVADLVDDAARTFAELPARIPAAKQVDLCAAFLGDEGDVLDWTRDDETTFKLRVRVHHAAQGVFVGISRAWYGRTDAAAFFARTMYIPAEVAERVASYCAA